VGYEWGKFFFWVGEGGKKKRKKRNKTKNEEGEKNEREKRGVCSTTKMYQRGTL